MSNDDDKPAAELRALYERLAREIPPARTHEARVLAALHGRGLLQKPARHRWALQGGRIAAALVVFFAGFGTHALTVPPPLQPAYLLLLENGPTYRAAETAAEAARRVGEYRDWASGLRNKGIGISGYKLKEDARGDAISGLFMVDVPDRAAVEAIVAASPHVRYGGVIVVREIERR